MSSEKSKATLRTVLIVSFLGLNMKGLMSVDFNSSSKKIVLLGAGGHCRVVIEACQANGFEVVGILDANIAKGTKIMGIPVLGDDSLAQELFATGVRFMAVSIVGNLELRSRLLSTYADMGFEFPSFVCKAAHLSEYAEISDEGVLIQPGTIVNAEAVVGAHATLNTGCLVEHQATVGCNSHIAPRSMLLGFSSVGDRTMIGAGAIILPSVSVGNDCIVGAGSVVLQDVPSGMVVAGNPAKVIRKKEL